MKGGAFLFVRKVCNQFHDLSQLIKLIIVSIINLYDTKNIFMFKNIQLNRQGVCRLLDVFYPVDLIVHAL